MKPKEIERWAQMVFAHACSNVMSHTLRGLQTTLSNEYKVDLTIKLTPETLLDHYEECNLPFCFTEFSWKNLSNISGKDGTRIDKLDATIYIPNVASRNAARFAISHEIFHIIDELEFFKKTKRPRTHLCKTEHMWFLSAYTLWRKTKTCDPSKLDDFEKYRAKEELANIFASFLCNYFWKITHDKGLIQDLHKMSDDFKQYAPAVDISTIINNMKRVWNKEPHFTKIYKFKDLINTSQS